MNTIQSIECTEHYETPEIEMIKVDVEKGFATSEELENDSAGFVNNIWKNQNW